MERSRPTKRILEFYGSLNKAKSETMTWIFAIKEDLGAAGITQTNLAKHIQAYHREKCKKTGRVWLTGKDSFQKE